MHNVNARWHVANSSQSTSRYHFGHHENLEKTRKTSFTHAALSAINCRLSHHATNHVTHVSLSFLLVWSLSCSCASEREYTFKTRARLPTVVRSATCKAARCALHRNRHHQPWWGRRGIRRSHDARFFRASCFRSTMLSRLRFDRRNSE